MEKYIGIDVHSTSCTVAVIGASGRRLKTQVVETSAPALIAFLEAISGRKRVCLEEGVQAAWLYEVLSPHVHELAVVRVTRESKGNKSDLIDANALADRFRLGAFKTRVYKEVGAFGELRALAKVYRTIVRDHAKIKTRIKAVFRSRGLSSEQADAFMQSEEVDGSLLGKLPKACRASLQLEHMQLYALLPVRKSAQEQMIKEAKKHKAYAQLQSVPGLGPKRVAELMPVVVTPHRFRTCRQFWSYSGFAVRTESSSDWHKVDGNWAHRRRAMTRGLSREYNHTLKEIFKGAARSIVLKADASEPLYQDYVRLLDNTKPNLAMLTLARKVAAITLAIWKKQEVYDRDKYVANKNSTPG